MKTLTIVGHLIVDIPTFYGEINRVFMADEDWVLGKNLDALNDLLYRGYGAIAGNEPVELVWKDMAASRSALGIEATRSFLKAKLHRSHVFNADLIGNQLNALDRGTGQTYFDIVLEIFADHPNIVIVTA